MSPASQVVVKVGGSLYDLPDLSARLRRWLTSLEDERILLVPGGGPTADVVRDLDRTHQLGAELAHWLALRSLSLNAHLLLALLPEARLLMHPEEWPTDCGLAVLDPHAFACRDEGCTGSLTHTWDVTSDSIAARVAIVARGRCVVLLKSTDLPEGLDWATAGSANLIDPHFASLVDGLGLAVQWVNLRRQSIADLD